MMDKKLESVIYSSMRIVLNNWDKNLTGDHERNNLEAREVWCEYCNEAKRDFPEINIFHDVCYEYATKRLQDEYQKRIEDDINGYRYNEY